MTEQAAPLPGAVRFLGISLHDGVHRNHMLTFYLACYAAIMLATFVPQTQPFLLAEVLAAAAREMGLPEETADRLASVTCFGAGAMLASSPGEAGELRRRVTSPGGTTQARRTWIFALRSQAATSGETGRPAPPRAGAAAGAGVGSARACCSGSPSS